jgi:hypothetical protein
MARSRALLGLSRWERTCSVEVAAIRLLRGNDQAFDAVRDFALANGGVVHWGQIHTVSSASVAGDIAAGSHEDGRIEIVARRQDSDELWARRQRAPGHWT